MDSFKLLSLLLISTLSIASATPDLSQSDCGSCKPPATDPKLPVPPVTVPKLPVPKLPLPSVAVPKLPLPPVAVPKLPLPPVAVPKLHLPPVAVPKLPLPPVAVSKRFHLGPIRPIGTPKRLRPIRVKPCTKLMPCSPPPPHRAGPDSLGP